VRVELQGVKGFSPHPVFGDGPLNLTEFRVHELREASCREGDAGPGELRGPYLGLLFIWL